MRYWCYYIARFLLWLFFRAGFDLKVSGQGYIPKQGPFIVASNHVSYLDPPLIGVACSRRCRFMARSSLFRHALLGAFLRAVNVIPLERGEADIGAIRKAINYLLKGEAIAIFPEGGRQLSGRVREVRRGVGLLALKAKVPIIPAFVRGTFEALPPHRRGLRRTKIQVAFGPPIVYTNPPCLGREGYTQGQKEVFSFRDRSRQIADELTQYWRRLEVQ